MFDSPLGFMFILCLLCTFDVPGHEEKLTFNADLISGACLPCFDQRG